MLLIKTTPKFSPYMKKLTLSHTLIITNFNDPYKKAFHNSIFPLPTMFSSIPETIVA